MNNYKKYLKYKYKYYALKKQIGGGKVTITRLTDYDAPSSLKLETYDDKVRNDFKPYSARAILDRLQKDPRIVPNKLYNANISEILNNHTGFIIETNDNLKKDIEEFLEYRGGEEYIIYIKFETQTNFFTKGKIINRKYINTILNTNQDFNDKLKEILMGKL